MIHGGEFQDQPCCAEDFEDGCGYWQASHMTAVQEQSG